MQQEQRSVSRVRTLLRAQIMLNDRLSPIDCVIRNYSAAGARIAIDDTLAVPGEFDLLIPARQRSYKARLVWRDRDSIGVNFTDAGAKAPAMPMSEACARVIELEAQNAELRERIVALTAKLEEFDPTRAF